MLIFKISFFSIFFPFLFVCLSGWGIKYSPHLLVLMHILSLVVEEPIIMERETVVHVRGVGG
jgi:hypothetical protein